MLPQMQRTEKMAQVTWKKNKKTSNGQRMIAGYFNFIMNIKLDKRGGRSDRGTVGRKDKNNGGNNLK